MTRSTMFPTLVAALCFAGAAAAQPNPSAEEILKMLEATKPSAEHQELAALAGRWTQDITYSMGGAPMKATGSVTNRMILGGRFLLSEGSSVNPPGWGFGEGTVEVLNILGFDRRTQDFTIVGYDTMGTYYVTAAGKKRDPHTIVMSGETLDETPGSKESRQYDFVLKTIDADTYLIDINFKNPGQPDLTVVSITYRRAK